MGQLTWRHSKPDDPIYKEGHSVGSVKRRATPVNTKPPKREKPND